MYGTVQDAVVMKDPVSRRSRGFGFITFTDIHAVDNALAHVPHTIDARKVRSSFSPAQPDKIAATVIDFPISTGNIYHGQLFRLRRSEQFLDPKYLVILRLRSPMDRFLIVPV